MDPNDEFEAATSDASSADGSASAQNARAASAVGPSTSNDEKKIRRSVSFADSSFRSTGKSTPTSHSNERIRGNANASTVLSTGFWKSARNLSPRRGFLHNSKMRRGPLDAPVGENAIRSVETRDRGQTNGDPRDRDRAALDARHAWRQRSMAAMASGVVGFCRANLRAQISLERYLTAAGRGYRAAWRRRYRRCSFTFAASDGVGVRLLKGGRQSAGPPDMTISTRGGLLGRARLVEFGRDDAGERAVRARAPRVVARVSQRDRVARAFF